MKCPIWILFLFALIASVLSSSLLPGLPFLPFSPFLAIAYLRTSHSTALWLATLAGCSIDLFCFETHLGLYTLAYLLTTLFIYPQRHHFFEDKPLAFCLYCTLISGLTTFWLAVFKSMTDLAFHWSLGFILSDLLTMPLFDAVTGWFYFIVPAQFYWRIKNIGLRRIRQRT